VIGDNDPFNKITLQQVPDLMIQMLNPAEIVIGDQHGQSLRFMQPNCPAEMPIQDPKPINNPFCNSFEHFFSLVDLRLMWRKRRRF
jgi:hypothetical protein